MSNLSEIHHDIELAAKNGEFKKALNIAPPAKWLKDHPFAKNNGKPVKYLSIGKTEELLDMLFQNWSVEIIDYKAIFNSVSCHVRLHLINPADGKTITVDGIGAVGVQTDAGKSASDLGAIKQDSIMKALPAAKSYAIKDATHHLGALFGRNANRADNFVFKNVYEDPTITKERERIISFIEKCNTFDELQMLIDTTEFKKYEQDEKVKTAWTKKKNGL